MGRYGRPKLPADERRTALTLNVRFSEKERLILLRKAGAAGLPATAWARYAALGQTPPTRRAIPRLNTEAWLELSQLAQAVQTALAGSGMSRDTLITLKELQAALADFRNLLIGNNQE